MKKLLIVLVVVLSGYFVFTGQKNRDDKKVISEAPPIWNIHKLTKWYTDRGITPPNYVASEIQTNPNSNESDASALNIRVFPSTNPQSENSIAISEVNSQNLYSQMIHLHFTKYNS